MYFSSWTEFLTMGGHGLYVWSAYAVALIVIVYNLLAPVYHRRQVRAQVLRQDRLDNARQKQSGAQMGTTQQNAVRRSV